MVFLIHTELRCTVNHTSDLKQNTFGSTQKFTPLLPSLHKITAKLRGIIVICAVLQHCYLLTVRFLAEAWLGNNALAYGLDNSTTCCKFPTREKTLLQFQGFHVHDLELRDPEDGSTRLHRNLSSHLPVHTA